MVALSMVVLVVLIAGILGILLVAVTREDVAAGVNAFGMLVATVLPLAVDEFAPVLIGQPVAIGLALPLWIAVAGFVHSVGMLGPYDTVWWWDVMTHTISAALVTALALAGLVVFARQTGALAQAGWLLGVLTVGLVGLGGVFWELLELVARDVGARFDIEPVLVHYGWDDTALDLIVDILAAVAIVLLDVRVFVPIAAQAPTTTIWLVLGTAGVLLVGTVVLAAIVGWTHDGPPAPE